VTLYRLSLGSHLNGFLATTAIGILFGLANAIGYAELAGTDPVQRAIFARQMEVVGRQLSYLLPLPLELDTMSGYLQWRMFGTLALIYGFWALLAASGAGRGDEERGLVETWLAAGIARARYLLVRSVAFATATAASIAIALAGTWAGSAIGNEPLAVGALALQGVDLFAVTACCFAIALLVAQLTATRRAAGGIAGILLLALFLIDSASRTDGLQQVAWLSPFWLYDRSTPLLRGGGLDLAAVAALLAGFAVLLAAAAAAFAARDLGSSLLRPRAADGRATSRPSGDPLLRLPVLATIDQQRAWILGWMLGLAALAAFLVSLTRTMVDALLEIPSMRVYFERLGPTGYDTFVAVVWGSTAMLLVSLLAIFQVSGWVADDAEGRLETALAQPIPRARVVLDRIGSLIVAAGIVLAGAAAVVWIAAARVAIPLSGDRFVAGSALMLAVPFAFGGVGAVVASSRPRLAVPLLTVVAVTSYFTQQFAPLFDWPKWVTNTSIYALYGTPMTTGVDWGGLAGLGALGVGGTALGVVLMGRRDIGT
jgi:hypothetical protein